MQSNCQHYQKYQPNKNIKPTYETIYYKMNNPWGVKLKKTGFNDKRLASEQSILNDLEQRQNELQNMALTNASKQNAYEDRQASLVADAIAGQQERLLEQVGKKKAL